MEQKKRERRTASKLCVRCGAVLPLNSFYGNKGWATQSFHDAWCKDCVQKHCVDTDTLREYFWYNNRRWADEFYEYAEKKARYTLANSDEYLKASKDKRAQMEKLATCRQLFSIMNLSNFYSYADNIGREGEYKEFNPNSPEGTIHAGDQAHDNGECGGSYKLCRNVG